MDGFLLFYFIFFNPPRPLGLRACRGGSYPHIHEYKPLPYPSPWPWLAPLLAGQSPYPPLGSSLCAIFLHSEATCPTNTTNPAHSGRFLNVLQRSGLDFGGFWNVRGRFWRLPTCPFQCFVRASHTHGSNNVHSRETF